MSEGAIHERARSESFRFVLRRATRADHQTLDDHPAFAALMSGTLAVDGYRRLMGLFHGFYAAHDRILAEACAEHGLDRTGFVYASRAAILADDVASLSVRSVLPIGLRVDPDRLAVDSAGSLAGMLYVFEGSMLGGAILCRAAEALLAAHGASGASYWQWCRDAGAARWAMTCAMLDEVSATPRIQEDMIDGAKAAFSGFGAWLSGWEDEPHDEASPLRSCERC